MIIYSDNIPKKLLEKLKEEKELVELLRRLRGPYVKNDKVESNQIIYIAIMMSKYRIPLPAFLTSKIMCTPQIYGSHKIITYLELMEYK